LYKEVKASLSWETIMVNLTTVILTFGATQADSPLFVGALTLTFIGLGTIVASFVAANRQRQVKK
jgi:uncharacterized integral membrane protein